MPVMTKSLKEMVALYADSPHITTLQTKLKESDGQGCYKLQGAVGSCISFLAAHLLQTEKRPILYLFSDNEEAVYALNELEAVFGKDTVLYFPASHRRPYELEETNNANVVLRTEVLNKISGSKKARIIVSVAEALSEKVVTKSTLSGKTIRIKTGEEISVDFLNELLFSYGFHRVDFVAEPGEFSVRGGIVDVFSFADETPYRLSFFGDEVESIRKFDIETQLSVEKINKFTIVPNLEDKFQQEKRQSFLKFIPKKTLVLGDDFGFIQKKIKDIYLKADSAFQTLNSEIKHLSPQELFLDDTDFATQLQHFDSIEFLSPKISTRRDLIEVNQSPQPNFHKQFELLIDTFQEQSEKKYKNYIFCSGQKQIDRLNEIFDEIGREVKITAVQGTIHSGFIDHDIKAAFFTDHQIFDRYHRFHLRNQFNKKESITLKELNTLQVGDFVTHIDHGVGKFSGLKRIEVNGKMQETIKLVYKDNDILYVGIHALHKISKFSGKDGKIPKINKLGSPAWKNLKNKTKRKVKEVAFDLIKLYAQRKMEKGFRYSPDSYLQNELEASFMYEDTPDQLKATEDVKIDMESEQTMDRLICGDVGFGKTEVAIRAAFKAATDGKQVAVLVPTTILAFQHYKTFRERLSDFPVRVEYLNRFKTAKQKREILNDLAVGKIDILIGTHQIVNAKTQYKDLGLLIVDEEHKFGVSVKDKLKTLRAHLDTLTLTATPIPRTLQFSLMAARDLSIIRTPPPNRQPVHTELIGFNEEEIRDAVFYELQRGGQVFVIYNRIAGLKELSGMIQRLVPEAKIATGHGQMDGKKLEATLLDFMDGKFDVLISTTIVESGVDVPNANTMLIVDAQNFGMADLHQMRGRVGRSNRKAFCYLITPPLVSLTGEARKRLQSIEQFSDLGSGFNIAMKDLEIRGAGNLLGAEQSGFMAEMGFETYQKILNEAIEELKYSEDFKDLFEEQKEEEKSYVSDFTLDTDLELLFPYHYINAVEERMILYSELATLKNEEQLTIFSEKLIDRFGVYPPEVGQLLQSIRLKWLAMDLGMEKIIMKDSVFFGYFINNSQSPFYQSGKFGEIIKYLQEHPQFGELKEKKVRGKELPTLMLKIKNIKSVTQAFEKLKSF